MSGDSHQPNSNYAKKTVYVKCFNCLIFIAVYNVIVSVCDYSFIMKTMNEEEIIQFVYYIYLLKAKS